MTGETVVRAAAVGFVTFVAVHRGFATLRALSSSIVIRYTDITPLFPIVEIPQQVDFPLVRLASHRAFRKGFWM